MAQRRRTLTRLQVVRTEWLTPHMLRIVAGGPGFASFIPNEYTDRYVKLVFLRPGVDYPEPLDLGEIRAQLPRTDWPITRTYTIRWIDTAAQELAIDVVYHGEIGVAGPWAAALGVGDEVLFAGPGGAYAPSADADWHLLAGDESALPAIGSALAEVPAGVPALAVIEVSGPAEEQALASPGAAEIRWLHRGESTTLPDAVRELSWRAGRVHAFVHGEAGAVRAIRSYLLGERRLDRDQMSLSGYWRRGLNEDGWQAEKAEIARREAEAATTAS